jgi:hypothetical protein
MQKTCKEKLLLIPATILIWIKKPSEKCKKAELWAGE